MDVLNQLLLFLVKLGLIFVAVVLVARWFLIIPYIWLRYDRPIMKLKTDLDNFRKQERKQAIAQSFIDGSINHKTREVNEQLEILETRRRLLLDRVNLFLSISSISDKH